MNPAMRRLVQCCTHPYTCKINLFRVFILTVVLGAVTVNLPLINILSSTQSKRSKLIVRNLQSLREEVSLLKADLTFPETIQGNNTAPKSIYFQGYDSLAKNYASEESWMCKNCFHFDFKLLINQPSFCENKSTLLIFIHSRPSGLLVRRLIRTTWASTCKRGETRCLFVLGNSGAISQNIELIEESNKYNDIIQYDFEDSYKNLTYKTMVSLLWAKRYCQTTPYIMKTDDDTYVNIELVTQLLQAAPSTDFYAGKCTNTQNRPMRFPDSKWFVSLEDYPFKTFPRYCYGSGYILSRDLVSKVVSVSKDVPYFFIEDVYIGMCVHKLNVTLDSFNGFSSKKTRFISSCTLKSTVFTVHKQTSLDLYHLWKKSQYCTSFKHLTPEELYNSTIKSFVGET